MRTRPIVIVEENPDDLYLLTRRIEQAGSKNPILDFAEPAAAIAYLERSAVEQDEGRPCVLFTDVHLIGGDGFQVLEWIRREPRLHDLQMFVISGSENPKHQARARELGAHGFVLKMPTVEKLKSILPPGCIESP